MFVISQIFGVTKTQHISNMLRLSALAIYDIPTHKSPTYLFLNPKLNF